MLFQWWANVEDGGPTSKRHWVNATCLLGYLHKIIIINVLVRSIYVMGLRPLYSFLLYFLVRGPSLAVRI